MRTRDALAFAALIVLGSVACPSRGDAQARAAGSSEEDGSSEEPIANEAQSSVETCEESSVDEVESNAESYEEFAGFGAEAVVAPLDARERDRRRVDSVSSAPLRRGDDLGRAFERVGGARFVRTGGLGAPTRIELDGFVGERVRLFLDGVPLDVAGYAFDPSVVPLGRVRAVEVHRGVVPLRLGADALGGAVEIVTAPPMRGFDAGILARVGSFATTRMLGRAAWRGVRGGYVELVTHGDRANNDYRVEVEIPDALGRPQPARVRRFHDAYRATGGRLELGVLERGPLARASLSVHASAYSKELAHDPAMRLPYGEARFGERLAGSVARLELRGSSFELTSVVAVSSRDTALRDVSRSVFDWRGDVVSERPAGGEIDGTPRSFRQRRHDVFAHVVGTWQPSSMHRLALGSTVRTDRTEGRTRVGLAEDEVDPLRTPRRSVRIVTGVEHRAEWVEGRLATSAFVKHHHVRARADELRVGGAPVPVSIDEHRVGPGAALHATWWPERLFAKLAYEHAARLPSANEIFGDGVLVQPGGSLAAERSHNVVGSVSFEAPLGGWRLDGDVRGFARRTLDQIQLLTLGNGFEHVNLGATRGLGAEVALRLWRSEVELEARATYQDLRNRSAAGPYGRFVDDRIPNVPWLFVEGAAGWTLARGPHALTISSDLKYVHGFLRDWASLGAPGSRPAVPAQFFVSVAADWRVRVGEGEVGVRLDVRNLGDARRFDAFGAQLPGREVALTVEGRTR